MKKDFRDTIAGVLGKKRRKPSGLYRSVKDGDLTNPIQLDEFLEGVGGILQLPPKETVVAPKTQRGGLTFTLPGLRFALPVAGVFVAAVVFGRPAEKAAPDATLPAQMIGLWTTADPRYRNRSFEVSTGFVVFKNGDRKDEQTAHEISGIRREERGDTTMLTLDYLDAGATYSLALKYLPRPMPAIIFANQDDMVWRKAVLTPARLN